jgi:hypothetical protein
MTPSSITVDLEHAKLLKEAGWPQETTKMAYWSINEEGDGAIVRTDMEHYFGEKYWNSLGESLDDQILFADAPTAEDILRRLPNCIVENSVPFALTCIKGINDEWLVGYPESHPDLFPGNTLANAAAAMYCYLAEHHLLDAAHRSLSES